MQDILPAISRREKVVSRLRWYAMASRHFGLGETPRQMRQRDWWDILSLRLVMNADAMDAPVERGIERQHPPEEDY